MTITTSQASLYSSEQQYKAMTNQYQAAIRAHQRECAASGRPVSCNMAIQLNTTLQNILGTMSTQLNGQQTDFGEPTILAQQAKLLVIADTLEADRKSLLAQEREQAVVTGSFKAHYLAWSLGALALMGLLWKKQA